MFHKSLTLSNFTYAHIPPPRPRANPNEAGLFGLEKSIYPVNVSSKLSTNFLYTDVAFPIDEMVLVTIPS